MISDVNLVNVDTTLQKKWLAKRFKKDVYDIKKAFAQIASLHLHFKVQLAQLMGVKQHKA
jgi:hypothetical protein